MNGVRLAVKPGQAPLEPVPVPADGYDLGHDLGQAPAEPVPKLVDKGIIELPCGWGECVDTPLSGTELNRLKMSIHRLVPFGNVGSDG
jgi:hypothetical protein